MALVTEQPEDTPTTNALAAEALIDAARIRFKGMSQDSLEDAPALDESRTYIVKAKCVEHQHKRMKDGEVRLVATMECDSIYERGKVPIVDEPQPGLFNADGQPNDDQGDGELPQGPEWGDAEASGTEPTKTFEGGPTFSSIEGGAGAEDDD